DLGRGGALVAVGDAAGPAIAMIDGDDLLDVVKLHGGAEVVPERPVPRVELRGYDADRRAREGELAVLPDEPLLLRAGANRLLGAGIDAGQKHRLVVAVGGDGGKRKGGDGCRAPAICRKRRRSKPRARRSPHEHVHSSVMPFSIRLNHRTHVPTRPKGQATL